MAAYRFLTTWCLAADVARVWDAIEATEQWPEWWPGVKRVTELAPGNEGRVGSRHSIAWRSRLPYELEFEFRVDRVERPHLMEGTAEGELAGIGRWRLYEARGTTAVLYEWNVDTTKPWMNRLAPLLRPVFAWNHDIVMRQGGEGLARALGVPLLTRS
jgi:uncharacterized protein YndB with AHSA1/START domain